VSQGKSSPSSTFTTFANPFYSPDAHGKVKVKFWKTILLKRCENGETELRLVENIKQQQLENHRCW